jgi:hypothetical protein
MPSTAGESDRGVFIHFQALRFQGFRESAAINVVAHHVAFPSAPTTLVSGLGARGTEPVLAVAGPQPRRPETGTSRDHRPWCAIARG